MIVRRINPLSLAKVMGAVCTCLGIVLALLGLLSGIIMGGGASMGALGLIGFGSLLFLPAVYGTIGFVGSLIAAPIYNLMADRVGGIEIDVG